MTNLPTPVVEDAWGAQLNEAVEERAIPTGGNTGDVLTKLSSDDRDADWEPPTGGINSIVAGPNVSVDDTDPKNPIVSASGGGSGSGGSLGGSPARYSTSLTADFTSAVNDSYVLVPDLTFTFTPTSDGYLLISSNLRVEKGAGRCVTRTEITPAPTVGDAIQTAGFNNGSNLSQYWVSSNTLVGVSSSTTYTVNTYVAQGGGGSMTVKKNNDWGEKTTRVEGIFIPASGASGGESSGSFVGFQASSSTVQTMVNATDVIINFTDSDAWDTDSIHDPLLTPSRFTVPSGGSGIWKFVVTLNYGSSNNTGDRRVLFKVNGTGTNWVQRFNALSATRNPSIQAVAELNLVAGDYVEVSTYNNFTGTLTVDSAIVAGHLLPSGVSGVYAYPPGSADVPPTFPNIKNDEFNGTSAVIWVDTPTVAASWNINSIRPSHAYLKAQGTSAAYVGKYQAVPTSYPYTITTKLTSSTGRFNYHRCGGIILVPSSPTTTSPIMYAGSAVNNGRGMQRISALFDGTFTSQSPQILVGHWGCSYIKLIVNSATSVDVYGSTDGYAWILVEASANPGFTPAFMGLAANEESSLGGVEAWFDYFRVS